jgi:ABC-2 type transport system permease protein
MTAFRALLVTEGKLLFRDPVTWLAAVVLPSVMLLVFGGVFTQQPDATADGRRLIDVFVPSLIVITVGTLGIQTLPIRLATYREKGVLRRFGTTPLDPAYVLAAQLVLYAAVSVVALALLVAVARVVDDVPLPRDPVGYLAAYALGMTSMFAIGLIIAAVAPSARAATAVAIPLFFAVMFLGGVYMPRALLPEIVQRIGEVTPPGVQGLTDAWLGTAPQLGPLAVLALVTVAVGAVATRVFRWE